MKSISGKRLCRLPEMQGWKQEERHREEGRRADHDITEQFCKSDVLDNIRGAESAIDACESAALEDRRALAAHAPIKRRR